MFISNYVYYSPKVMINVSIQDLSITLRPSSVHSSIRFLSSDSKSRPSSSTTTSSSSATAQWVKNGKKRKNELLDRDNKIAIFCGLNFEAQVF